MFVGKWFVVDSSLNGLMNRFPVAQGYTSVTRLDQGSSPDDSGVVELTDHTHSVFTNFEFQTVPVD